MKLQQLRVSQFRQFRGSLDIDGFGPGLNLFCGPNESGKSTLVKAIRAAFFERYSSGTLTDLRPWGDSGAAPEVQLSFEHDGRQWQLSKRFLQRPRCDLTVDNESFSGNEAEEKLAAMLGFSIASRGASKAEHWGIPGLLWIEQGMGQELEGVVSHAGEHLKSVLGASLGEVTSSRGDGILRQVRGQLDELLTGTGKPRGEYRSSIERQAELSEQLQGLDQRIANYRQQVDRLGELRQQQAADQAEQPWQALRLQQQTAQQKYDEVSQWQVEQQRELHTLAQLAEQKQLLLDSLSGFDNQAADLQQRQAACVRQREELDRLLAQQTELIARRDAAQTDYQRAREQERQAQQQARRQMLERELQQSLQQSEQYRQGLEQARQLQQELLTQQQALAGIRLDEAALARLETLRQQRRELDIQRQSIATRLRFELLPEQRIELNGELRSGTGEDLLLEQAEIVMAGLGRLTITPGGQDLAELARRSERVDEQYAQQLDELGVASLEAARQQLEHAKSLQTAIQSGNRLLTSHAPQGVDALQRQLELCLTRQEELQQQLQTLPAATGDVPTPEVAERLLEQADDRLQQHERAVSERNEEVIRVRQALTSADQECQQLQRQLEAPERRSQQQQISQRLVELKAEEGQLQQRTQARGARIDSARPDILEQDIQRFAASARQLEQAFNQRREELLALQGRLEGEGADGLEENRAALAAELEAENRRLQQFQRRSAALGLLHQLLAEQRQQLTRQLQAPLQKHLSHYLQLLFPQASLEVDEHLLPGRLLRQGQEGGEFEALSFGAREQMGLISRLAYADLLRDAGRATLIILDDALVHSDPARLAQMKRILFDAAQRHQILLFSCHPDKWRDMGVPVRELESLKVQ